MHLYRQFLQYVKPYWPLAMATSLCFVLSGFLGAYPIQLFKRALDAAEDEVIAAARAANAHADLLAQNGVYRHFYESRYREA